MDKKKLLPIIIIGLLIIELVFSQVMYRVYVNSGMISSSEGYNTYVILTMFAQFFLTNSFYIMILLFFREHKLLTNYSALMLIISFSFSAYVSLSNYYGFETLIIRLYAGTSYFLAFGNMILAVAIVLKEIHTKRVSVSLLYFSVVTFVFGTLVTDYVRGTLVNFFGSNAENTSTIFMVYDIFLIILQISVAVLQVFAIRSLIDVKEGNTKVVRQLY